MDNIMNGELGIMTYCDRCGKELFQLSIITLLEYKFCSPG